VDEDEFDSWEIDFLMPGFFLGFVELLLPTLDPSLT
jgi:hypothetical protein